ncbi:ABC transporter substrate-binding protein [Paraburkholderia aspalathi]|nr:ABC transporter substrate-binding protein [Paraburkholderia aspalathi]
MKLKRRTLLLGAALIGLALPTLAQAADKPIRGGVATIATIGEPPALDPTVATGDLLAMITQHFYETLYTFDANWQLVPLVAEAMPDISEDGKVYTIPLRRGITFHDGKTMTSADVLTSLNRWLEVASRGRTVAPMVKSMEALDEYTVRITLTQAYTPLLALLAFNNSAAVIVPEGTPNETIEKPIGTGPYMVKERRPDRYIQLARFENYLQREGDPDGFGGARKQYLDEIIFVPVPDANTRIEGALAGQYHYTDLLPVESYDRLADASSKSAPVIIDSFGWPLFVFNTKQGLMSDQKIRQAAQMSMSSSDMLGAAFGNPAFYKVDGALYPEGYSWRSEAGLDGYNQADPEGAAKLLKEAGYDGSPVRILTSRQYEFHYKMAQVFAEYLKQAGFTVDMQVVDWATLTQRRADPALFDVFLTHYPFLAEPALILNLADTAPGWWSTDTKNALLDQFNTENDPLRRAEIFSQIQELVSKEVPFYKVGDFNSVSALSPELKDYKLSPWPYFWNTWIEK